MLKNIEPQSPSMQGAPHPRAQESDVSIIRREFVELTGDHFSAVILNQLLYWTLRVKDFDYLLEEERKYQPKCNVSPRHGWIYKTAPELNEETMLGLSPPSIRKYLKLLIDEGWVDEREHPTEKWNKTTQYRVNVRRLQEDLDHQGHSLPEVYLKVFRGTFQRKPLTQQNACENLEKTSDEKNFSSKQRNFSSNERIFASSENSEVSFDEESHLSREILNQRNFASNEKNFGSNEKIFASNEKFFGSNTENTAKTTSKNTSKEQQQGACARENFSAFKNSDSDEHALDTSIPDEPVPDASVAAEMVKHWECHVTQNLPAESENRCFRLTDERRGQLESLFAFHFQNDMRLWERFCLRVKAPNFLMGGGANGWTVSLDWILRKGSLSKILEGNYDNSKRSGQQESLEWKLEKLHENSVLDGEKVAVIASIKDPIWRKWCGRLAAGVRLNEFKMAIEPLSVVQLQQIANAWFLEIEDDRLVWLGSSDQRVLNKIDGLRLKINWVFAKEYPNARTFRTRLVSELYGEHHE